MRLSTLHDLPPHDQRHITNLEAVFKAKAGAKEQEMSEAANIIKDRNIYGHALSPYWQELLKVMRFSSVLGNQ